MRRKTTDTPTRIYSYRCLPPITEQLRVEDQYRLAHQYRNSLVEIERRLRDRFRDVVLACAGTRWALLHAEDCDAAVDDAYDDLRAAKSGGGAPTDAQTEHLAACEELRRAAWDDLRAAKREHAETLRPGYDLARAESREQIKTARRDYSSRGLRHGAYARIETAMQQASRAVDAPTYTRYTGEGSIGTQLTGDGDTLGLTVDELYSCMDTRVRLGPPGALDRHPRREIEGCTWRDVWRLSRNVRRHAARTYVDLRVGSNPDRSPIFARFPVTYHRPLPSDAVIKWAYVVRKRVGRRYEWRLQFTIESETFRAPHQAVGCGVAALNLGWRNLIDDEGAVCGIRVGYLVDDAREREILLPERTRHGMDKPRDLASIRARAFDEAIAQLRGAVSDTSPEWLREAAAHVHQWRAERRLAALVDRWERHDGDDAIYACLQRWAKQDRHLLDWQEHQRQRAIAHRRETYRVLASELCRMYATIVMGEIDLSAPKLARRKRDEDGDPSEGRDQRATARLAAPGELRDAIRKAAHKHGTRLVELDAGRITTTCHVCLGIEEWDRRADIAHKCESCGAYWDQDANACHNLLRLYASGDASGGGRSAGAEAFDAGDVRDHAEMHDGSAAPVGDALQSW